jgi:hypothetical protein
VLQPNVKFASLKEQALFYGDFPDVDPIDYYDVDVGQGSPEELADAIEGLITSAEQSGMSRDGVQSLRQLVTECKDVFRHKLGADPRANVKPLVIKLRDGAEPVRMSARKYAPPQLKFMAQKRRWIFVKAIGRYLFTKIHKTVNFSSRQVECTRRHVYYMERGMRRNICSLCS